MSREFSVNLGLPSVPLTEQPELFSELSRVYNAIRNVMGSVDTYTGIISPPSEDWSQLGVQVRSNGMNRAYVPAFEAMNPGDTVAFMNDAGTVKARKGLDATYRTRGFCSNPVAVTVGGIVQVTLMGVFPYFSPGSLTVNGTYYASGTAGLMASGGTHALGYAITDSLLFFNPVP